MTKKLNYEAPESQTLVVRFEGSLMTLVSEVNTANHTQYLIGAEDDGYETL